MNKKGFVVIVEGVDKTGKTSLARALGEMLGWPVVKFSQPGPRGAMEEYMSALSDHPGPFIADRFHLGESVYGPVYRGTPPLNAFDVRSLENALLSRGALLVLMEDRADRIAERFVKLGEDFAKVGDIDRLLREFDAAWRRSRLAKIRGVWHTPALPAIVHNLVSYMVASAQVCAPVSDGASEGDQE